jgi:hypothetical protein
MLNAKQVALLDDLVALAPQFDMIFEQAKRHEAEKGACATYSRVLAEVLQEFGWRKATVKPVYIETTNKIGMAYLRGEMTAEQAKAAGGTVQIWGDISEGASYMHAVCYNPSWETVIDLAMTVRGSGLVPSHPYWGEIRKEISPVGKWPWWIVRFEFKNYPLTYRAYDLFPKKVKEAKALVRSVLRSKWQKNA